MWTVQPQEPFTSVQDAEMAIYQDSSGGVNWQSANHVNAEGRVMHRFQGYRVQVGETTVAAGKRAAPTILVYDPRDDQEYRRRCGGVLAEFSEGARGTRQPANHRGVSTAIRRCL